MNYRTLADMARLIRANIARIPRVDAVVGIPRSGMIAASMIATLTNQKLAMLKEVVWQEVKTVLLVDDSIAGGTTMMRAVASIPYTNVKTLAVFVKPEILKAESATPDIWLEEVPGPRVFEWNWHRSKYLPQAMLDIDGVISTETRPGERNGSILYRPAREVLTLATGRKTDEREETEKWLAEQNVRYRHLFMSPIGQRARETKLQACEQMRPTWIVESNIRQAEWLRARTGLPVLCVDENRMM